MKKVYLLSLALLAINLVFADNWEKVNSIAPIEPQISLMASQDNHQTIQFNLNAYALHRVQTPRGEAFTITSPEASPLLHKGAPDMPKLTASVIIPDKAGIELEVIYNDYIEIENIDVAPSKGNLLRTQDPEQVPYTYSEVYNQDQYFPIMEAVSSEPYIIRNYRGICVTAFPFRYNPVQKTLRIYTEITVQIKHTAEGSINILERNKNLSVSEDYREIYKNHFLNYSEAKYTPLDEGTPGRMLIIAYDDFMDEMEPYVTWKREKGIETEIVDMTTVGSTAADIGTYIENEFNTNGLNYVLLVGDAPQVPTNEVNSDSDNEYVYLLGSDHYADCFIGRISAESGAGVTNQVNKIIEYERDYDNTNTWIENALCSASNEGSASTGDDGESDAEHMNNIVTDLENYGYTVNTVYQDGGSNAQATTAFNAGISVVQYVGHGDVDTWVNIPFSNNEVNALTNENKYPFIWSVACLNGDFKENTCFAEAWMRATNEGTPTGAISFLGSTIIQSWASPMDAQDEMNDLLVESYVDNIKRTFGGLSFNGMFHMIDEYSSDGENMADTWTIFGDPSLMVRTKTPSSMVISHNDVITVGETSFTVSCDADDALVSLTKTDAGETVIIGTGYVQSGSVDVPIVPFTAPGNMKITVTAYNKVTYQSDITVIVPEGPYVVLNDVVIDDATGNNNAILNNGESALLDVTLENVGVETATGVSADISTTFPDCTITDNTETYGDIASNATANADGAYNISVVDGIADQTIIPIEFIITDNDTGVWNASHNITVHAPELSISFDHVDDAAGNENGIMDPGEEVTVYFLAKNTGHNLTVAGNCNINITENASPVQTDVAVSELTAGSSELVAFTVNVDAGVPSGSSMPADLVYTSGEYSSSVSVNLPIGLQIEDWETNDFYSYNWQNDGTTPWTIVGLNETSNDYPYEGDYCARSGSIGDGETSTLEINIDVTTAGDLSFYKKISCQEPFWGFYLDFLAFYLDDAKQDQWAGEIDWSQETYSISTGVHNLKWTYEKDGFGSGGSDAAWLDDIVLPPHDQVTIIQQQQMDVKDFSFSIMPNPASDKAHVLFNLTEQSDVTIKLIDMHGRTIRNIYDQKSPQGKYNVTFDVNSLSEGMYMIFFSTGNEQKTGKMLISK
ncbi:MAG: C25 family cysteine peptidase [Bacteroidales bacterium]